MKNLNLTVQITENGNPFIKTYKACYMYKGKVINGICFANKKSAENEIETYKDFGYKFLYFDTEIVFL